jgi:hypothetical protein
MLWWWHVVNRKWLAFALAILFFIAGFLILYEQYVTFGVFFDLSDVLHHENFAIAAIAVGIGVLIGAIIVSKNQK